MSDARVLFLFPGQGSQYKGIGSDICAEYETARNIYSRASEVLGYDIAELSHNDPKGEIDLTRYTQPVLLTHQIACLEVYKELASKPLQPAAAAGHSLGEYSALVAAEALSFEDALRLVQKRGEFMGTYGEGQMLATQLDLATAQPYADKHFCGIAALNMADQTVIGGKPEDLERLSADVAEDFPRKRSVMLKTEGAFHTYYMVEAARRFREELDKAEIQAPKLQVLSNYTGGYHAEDATSIKSRLFFQLFHPVNWVGCLQTAIDDGTDTFVEFGGGIGKGETPAEKRANLESIIKKTTRRLEREIHYKAAINCATLQETAAG